MKELCIILKTEDEENEVLKVLEKQGYEWACGDKPTSYHCYSKGKNIGLCISCGKISWTSHPYHFDCEKLSAKEFLSKSRKPIVIYRNGNETVALDKSTGKKGIARCNPVDEYDFYTGAKLAFERLTEPEKEHEPEPERFYNGKVVCVDNVNNPRSYTVGKIYEFKDGIMTNDKGRKFPSLKVVKIHDFKEWAIFSKSKWIEIVE